MDIKPINNDKDYHAAVDRMEALFGAKPGTAEAEELAALKPIVSKYETKRFPLIPIPKR